jgi:tRNA threonylcarbamoyladenosine biosynthesis protein TsaE
MNTRVAREEAELEGIARELLQVLETKPETRVIALTGDLGAGKTALTKALARVLGVREQVTSPTFVIMKSYATGTSERFSTLTHIDAYRIESEDELRVLGFEELLSDTKQLVVIEWPERISGLIPKEALTLSIAIGEEGERIISYGR